MASTEASTVRSRSIPGSPISGATGSSAHVSSSGGGFTATARGSPQAVKSIAKGVIAAISSLARVVIAFLHGCFRLCDHVSAFPGRCLVGVPHALRRSEEHTSELQSLMRISYAVFCLKKKKNQQTHATH